MNKTNAVKTAAKIVTTIGTGIIVKAIINNNVDSEQLSAKITVPIAGLVIGSIASDIVAQYTDTQIDHVSAWLVEHTKK